ncbi:hypothetical protein [Metabacillus bambusae]|uniref:YtzI protein n=1 Tax=Metabacillus bambusae TaxID=2795218 RepID=A0ABS3N3S4_9BACI|nr:hypothetical protein [Metabacillus bambusae]MBO1512956.1 hypothetical protein [Metabacillus bambusae]
MLNWWLATISLGGFLVISIGLVLYTLKSSVCSDDAYRVDPLPNDDTESKE